jgi:hypothetical protein
MHRLHLSFLLLGNRWSGKTTFAQGFQDYKMYLNGTSATFRRGANTIKIHFRECSDYNDINLSDREFLQAYKGAFIMIDAYRPWDLNDIVQWKECLDAKCKMPIIILVNKMDLGKNLHDELIAGLRDKFPQNWYPISSLSGDGIDEAVRAMVRLYRKEIDEFPIDEKMYWGNSIPVDGPKFSFEESIRINLGLCKNTAFISDTNEKLPEVDLRKDSLEDTNEKLVGDDLPKDTEILVDEKLLPEKLDLSILTEVEFDNAESFVNKIIEVYILSTTPREFLVRLRIFYLTLKWRTDKESVRKKIESDQQLNKVVAMVETVLTLSFDEEKYQMERIINKLIWKEEC